MEDLVADGLITLHMEANNVDEYLQSARESTKTRQSLLPNQLEPISELLNHKENNNSDPLPPPLPPRYILYDTCNMYTYM